MRVYANLARGWLARLGIERQRLGVLPKREIARFIGREPTIVEIGAHIGSDTLMMSSLWPRGSIHAVEPIPSLHERLQSVTKWRRNIQTYPLALAAHSGTAEMHVSRGGHEAASSLLSPHLHLDNHPEITFNEKIQVPTMTLDDWADYHKISRIDLLWMDAQGSELAILKSGERILATVKVIHAEVLLQELYDGAALYPELRDWLALRGFVPVAEALPWPDAGNVLFIAEDVAKAGAA